MLINANWSIWRQSNSARAAFIEAMILDDSWWDHVEYLLRFTEPILSMIRYTDMDRPCLGEVYNGIDSMIEDIRNIINEREQDPEEKFFKELQIIMVERCNKMTTPLNLLAFALSPRFYSQLVLRGVPLELPHTEILKLLKGTRQAYEDSFPSTYNLQ